MKQTFRARYPLADLREHPDNPRIGDESAIGESIDALGFYGAVIVQESTGYIIAGNHRSRVQRDRGAKFVPAILLDVDDDTARRIMLADNRTSDLATNDAELLLAALMRASSTPDELAGTGYSDRDLAEMIAASEDAPPDGFPIVDPDDLVTRYECPKCQYRWA